MLRNQPLEGEIASALSIKNQIVAVSGPSKAGKTVLVHRVVREALGWQMIVVSGNDLRTIGDFWSTLAANCGVPAASDFTAESAIEVRTGAGVETGVAGIAKIRAQVDSGGSVKRSTRLAASTDLPGAVQEHLRNMDVVVVIDDFHYAPEDVRVQLARALKNLSFHGVPIVVIAIPHRVLSLVLGEQDLLGRVAWQDIAHWVPMELVRIPMVGLRALNVDDIQGSIADRLVKQSFRSPLLMQWLTREVCRRNGVLDTQPEPVVLDHPASWSAFFADVAKNFEHPLADAFLSARRSGKGESSGS